MMKKTLYIPLLVLVATLAAACTKHTPEAIQPNSPSSSYIFFQPDIMEEIDTRANTVQFTGDKFGVIGYVGTTPIFTGYSNNIAEVKKEGSLYVYDNLAQWADATSAHNFYAFYPYGQTIVTDNSVPFISYTQPTTVDGMVDVMTATTSVSRQDVDNGLVLLNFTHRLWALDVKVNNSQSRDVITNPEGTDVTIAPNLYITGAKIHIYGYRKAGNISMGENKIEGSAKTADETEVVTFDLFTASTATPSIMVESEKSHTFDPLLFLPIGKTFAYRLEINFKNAWGASYDYYYPALTMDDEGNRVYGYKNLDNKYFVAGYRYSLEVEKKDAEGSFNINWDVKDWEGVGVYHTFK